VSAVERQPPLIVAIDFRQPQSYLAKGPTLKLAAALGIEIDWQPMEARPLRELPSETAGDDRGARHRRFRARYFEHDLRRYAESQGLTLGNVRRAADSSVAGTGLLWAKRHAARTGDSSVVDAYVDRVFDGYWGGALALAQPDAIRGLLERVGVPAAGFDPGALRAEYDALLGRWAAAGMVEAPAYLVGDEVFIGRAHLPMIEWLLTGRAGPPPV
jgi:2-hydroxychromene-2-carboxylate isomerase